MKVLTKNATSQECKPAGPLDFFIPISNWIDVVTVTDTSATYTVPTGAKRLVFSKKSSFNFACRENNDAVFPAGTITNGSGSQINPAGYDVSHDTTTIGIIGDVAGPNYLSVAVYK